jgi:hypothetical protein
LDLFDGCQNIAEPRTSHSTGEKKNEDEMLAG